jgi:hypothetical protein
MSQFCVFGYENGMLRLHEVNGVIIEVSSKKMSAEDTFPSPGPVT